MHVPLNVVGFSCVELKESLTGGRAKGGTGLCLSGGKGEDMAGWPMPCLGESFGSRGSRGSHVLLPMDRVLCYGMMDNYLGTYLYIST